MKTIYAQQWQSSCSGPGSATPQKDCGSHRDWRVDLCGCCCSLGGPHPLSPTLKRDLQLLDKFCGARMRTVKQLRKGNKTKRAGLYAQFQNRLPYIQATPCFTLAQVLLYLLALKSQWILEFNFRLIIAVSRHLLKVDQLTTMSPKELVSQKTHTTDLIMWVVQIFYSLFSGETLHAKHFYFSKFRFALYQVTQM